MSQANYIHGTTPTEQERLALLNRMTNAAFIDFLALRGDERVLEIGSGLGILAAEVAAACPRGAVTGIEYSPDQLARSPRGVANLSFLEGDAHQLPFGAGEFDVVYCRYLLEHVGDPARVVSEACRVLAAGGRICIQENDISLVRHDPPTPAFDHVWQRFAELQRRLGGDAYIGRRLFGLLKAAGFQDLELSFAPEIYAHGDERYIPWLENLIGNVESGRAGLIAQQLATPEQIEAAITDLRRNQQDPLGSTWFAWNRAAGRKNESGRR
jgi:SAM-dependent methyltransferase